MKKRRLGHSDLEIAPLAFGGNVFGWTIDEAASFQILDRFVDRGFNFIDTADVYSAWKPGNKGGESETIIGRWLKQSGQRSKVIIATKVGMEMGPDKKGLSKAYIFKAVEDSLTRLQTDYIDLYQSHKDDPTVPQLETLQAYAELIKQGKVRFIGASNFSAARLLEGLRLSRENGLPQYQSLQPLYNLYDRSAYEGELEEACELNGLGVIPYFSLASGFLTGKYRSEADLGKSLRGERYGHKFLNERGFRILKVLDEVAAKYKTTQAQVAIAWLLSRPSITAPIASATNLDQLDQLLAATELPLDPIALEYLNL
jgi:aryl-alcohol dehydrogenase-like predicted oxidoreductase